ncbi:MAG: aminofutalosine synthase MqnE [Nitrospinae bacterium]|nr:aminofutalosine synthase MqnE [Nitrospinota bacterium]
MINMINDKNLNPIGRKVVTGKRLNFKDGVTLFNSKDFHGIGYLANIQREKISGRNTYFIQNGHINPTNICVNDCKFCAFKKKEGEKGAYQMSIEAILEKAKEEYYEGLQEFHIVGGLNEKLNLDFYEEMFAALRENFPTVHIQALTAVEIAFIAQEAKVPLKKALSRLKNAGLGSIPGGGAEIFDEELRKKICPKKITGEEWLEVMRVAHSVGLKSNATMLYGHLETVEHRVNHLLKLRNLQNKTHGFLTFIPLAFHPQNTDYSDCSKTPSTLDLKMIAISRLMLDNFPHIKAFWIMTTLPIAQLAQFYGADDIDGTILEEKITHSAGGETPQSASKNLLIRLINESGYLPVERDTLYNPVKQACS